MKPRIYLAGPTVFLADADDAGARLVALCAQYGCEGLYPLDFDLDGPMSSRTIQAACLRELRSADGVVADLSPFRGPHADDGTAFELGFAHALGLPIWAYTTDPRPLIERIPGARAASGHLRDDKGLLIENFGRAHNAMLAEAILHLGTSPEESIRLAAETLRR
ncbi:nucleoside 2-deoxyribosyltransferase [Hyphomicrobium sp. CS1BSMeth3]|uniref:nucleoside 2-deoxyribosyltransferase n=1 Tax=Hyphomicrobium sp. CS1BSMeth3 TaxID=1892844 RepID=UPI00093166B1|nr:nucleoside 2-deoxyribosyltransferase [Hyphomicrobium sp. CS1BSMeth3]